MTLHDNKWHFSLLTRTKTSIRYAKENDREKREKRRERKRDIEWEGEIRERDIRDIYREGVKGSRIEHSRTGCALS